MIKSQLKKQVDDCFAEGVAKGLWSEAGADKYTVEVPKHEGQGDFSTNLALVIAGMEKKNPREIAQNFVELFSSYTEMVEKVEVAGQRYRLEFCA